MAGETGQANGMLASGAAVGGGAGALRRLIDVA